MVDEMPHAIFFDSPLRSYYEFINTFNIAVIDVIVYTSNTLYSNAIYSFFWKDIIFWVK